MSTRFNKTFLSCACAILISCATAGAQTITNGLVGYWPMDNTQGTSITDHTSTTNDGWFVDGSPSWVPGKFGNAMDLYKETFDSATIPHNAAYNANDNFTISFWYYSISAYREYNTFTKGPNDINMAWDNGDNAIDLAKFGTPWVKAPLVGNAEEVWYHIVIVYDPYTANTNEAKRVYVDGSLVASNSTAGVGSDSALNTEPIGFSLTTDDRKASGRWDDIAIWDRVLATNEIDYLYNSGTGNIVSDLNPPPEFAPESFGAIASDQSVALSWASNSVDPDAYRYAVYRALSAPGPFTTPVATNLALTSCTDTNLVNGTDYFYVVRTVDFRGAESTNSVVVQATPYADTTPPAVPSGVAAEAGYKRVYLSWSANGEGDLAGYNVYSSAAAGGPFALAQGLVTSTTWQEDGLVNGTPRHYRVAAEDIGGNESAQAAAVSATPVGFHDTNPGLVGYWPLDETSGAVAVDISVTGNDGVFTDDPPIWAEGKLGGGLTLDETDGSTDRLTISNSAAYTNSGEFSIAFWYKNMLGYKMDNAFQKGDIAMGWAIGSDAVWGAFGTDPWPGWPDNDLGFNYEDAVWHHITLVYEPSVTYGKRVYVDSVLVVSNTVPAGPLDTALNGEPIVLQSPYNSGRTWSNHVDEVAIWDVPLTIDQIESLWNEGEGRPAYTPPPSGTVLIIR